MPEEKKPRKKRKNPRRIRAGKARAENLTQEELSLIGKIAGVKRWAKHNAEKAKAQRQKTAPPVRKLLPLPD